MRRLPSFAACLVGLTVPCIAQQGPDILLPSGSLDGTYMFVDRNKDGKYMADGDAYDYVLAGSDTSPRNYAKLGNKLFFSETIQDHIVWIEDANQDGLIQSSERHVFYDAGKALGSCAPNFVTLDKNGWLWWTNDSGTKEGIYKSKDLNNDGDAEDTGETIPVLVEPATVVVANTPKTPVANLAVTGLQSISYDSSWGTYGRFLCEEENWDQTIAFEDKNNDGDFADTGEVYLFCALWTGGTLGADVNPDVTAKKIPAGTEMRQIEYDPVSQAYYLLSADSNTSTHPEDHGLIYRGKEGGTPDGDINDAGEVTIFFDCSHNSKGALKGYNFLYGMTVWQGKIYIMGELDGPTDFEHLIVLSDNNKDGDAMDTGEAIVLWEGQRDRTHYKPGVFPPSTFPVPAGLPGIYNYYGPATCASSLPGNHNIQVGSNNWNEKCVIGATNFTVRTWGCKPAAPGIYMVGTGKIDIALDQGGTCHLLQPALVFLLPFLTGAGGDVNIPLPLPNDPALIGVWSYWQSLVIDATAAAGLGFTISDAFEMRLGAYSYSPI